MEAREREEHKGLRDSANYLHPQNKALVANLYHILKSTITMKS